MPINKGKTNWVCPECGGRKYRYSDMCRECRSKHQTNNPDGRWARGKFKNKNYGKVICPECNKNYKTRNAKMCWECGIQKRLSGRNGSQHCIRCGDKLTKANWSNSRRKYWNRICAKCDKTDKESRVEKINISQKEARRRVKEEMISAYGGKCQCCGEANAAFLTIDHIDGRGGDHLKKVKSSKGRGVYRYSGDYLYRWLKQHGWPTDNFQLLCMNCNFAKSHNPGGCPHEIERQKQLQEQSHG